MLQVYLFVVCCECTGQGPGFPSCTQGIPIPQTREGVRVHGPCHPPVLQNRVEGGCACRKDVSPWLAVSGQGKSFWPLPWPEQLLEQLGEHQGGSGFHGTRMQHRQHHCLHLPLTSIPPKACGNHKGRKRECSTGQPCFLLRKSEVRIFRTVLKLFCCWYYYFLLIISM